MMEEYLWIFFGWAVGTAIGTFVGIFAMKKILDRKGW
jgi:hypothetical protein